MANFNEVMETQRSLEATLLKRMNEFEIQLQTTAPHTSNSVTHLTEEFSEFKSQVWSLLKLLRQQIAGLATAIDVIEMRHRRKYLLFSGVSEDIKDELPDFIAKLIRDKLGMPHSTLENLRKCHRLGRHSGEKPRPVLVRYADQSLRAEIWRKKVAFKGTPYTVSEFLTRHRQSLFLQARQRFGMKRCWTMDGNVIVKLKDGSRRRLLRDSDLSELAGTEDEERPAKQMASQTTAASPERPTKIKRAARVKK